MEPCEDIGFRGFDEEEPRVSGYDLEQVRERQGWYQAGVRTLYVAWSEGQPAYCQWLLYPDDLPALVAANPSGKYEPLEEGEVLLEGAYTFVRFRGAGAMADCMGQLVRIAAEDGCRTAYTCVAEDNVPSLKGCARVGFAPDRLRSYEWRLGRHHDRIGAGHDSEAWRAIG
jgi:RimJ/RimL family protein N-acetyltransferase